MHSGNDCRLQTPQMVSMAAANLFMITARDGKTIFNSIAVYTSPQMKCYNCTTGPLNQTKWGENCRGFEPEPSIDDKCHSLFVKKKGGGGKWTTGEKYRDL